MDHRVKPGGDEENAVQFDKTRAHARRENGFLYASCVGAALVAARWSAYRTAGTHEGCPYGRNDA